jgi:hypothetical protein
VEHRCSLTGHHVLRPLGPLAPTGGASAYCDDGGLATGRNLLDYPEIVLMGLRVLLVHADLYAKIPVLRGIGGRRTAVFYRHVLDFELLTF